MSKIKIEDISSQLNSQGWRLLSTEYVNLDTQMQFECPEGHLVLSTWKKMRQNAKCPVCEKNVYSNLDLQEKIFSKPKGAHRILALDQSSHVTGYTIMDDGKVVKYGTFSTDLNDEIARINRIKMWLLSMIENWKPDFIGIEGIQYQDNVAGGAKMGITVFQTLARLQGVLLELCFEKNIPYDIVPTNTWRHYCGVKGTKRVDRKRSMQLLVKNWYDISVSDDIADSIGIAKYFNDRVTNYFKIENWEN